jgi:hypothetical protein
VSKHLRVLRTAGFVEWTLILVRELRHPPAAVWLLAGASIGRIVGGDAMKFDWQRLNAEYAKQLGVESPPWPGAKS